MKYYVIEGNNGDWSNLFIVKSKSKKEAFKLFWKNMDYDNQIVEECCIPHYKKDFTVTEIEDLLEENMAVLN